MGHSGPKLALVQLAIISPDISLTYCNHPAITMLRLTYIVTIVEFLYSGYCQKYDRDYDFDNILPGRVFVRFPA